MNYGSKLTEVPNCFILIKKQKNKTILLLLELVISCDIQATYLKLWQPQKMHIKSSKY